MADSKKKFAVFDIDGTITRSSLLQLMVRQLIAHGKLDVGSGRAIETKLHDFRQRTSDEEFGRFIMQAVTELFNALPNGLRTDEFNEIIDAVVKRSLTSTYVYPRELAQTLKKNGFFLIAISGSELHCVEGLSRALGFDAWVGQVAYQQKDGWLTGEVKSLDKPKSEVLTDIITKFNLETKGSMAVGDTSSDIDVLSMVNNPVAFNPNQSLFKTAQKNGWMVVVERKDMVYFLDQQDGTYILRTADS